MAEGERERGEGSRERVAFPWCQLPQEVQQRVLSRLSLRNLFQARCVCCEWHSAVHHHDFAALYDEVHDREPRRPAICYLESARIHLATYEPAEGMWRKMTSLSWDGMEQHHGEDCGVYSVGGLLCLHFRIRGAGTWVVWNPLTGRWKRLPPYKHAPAFVHAFQADGCYKILMAHFRIGRHHRSLVTELYDSSTGRWMEPAPDLILQLRMVNFPSPRGGVLSNGVVYFRATRTTTLERVLLCYDTSTNAWRVEASDRRCTRVFEWDGRVMTIMPDNTHSTPTFRIYRRDPENWTPTSLEIPTRIKRRFDYSVSMSTALLEIVAAGDYLVVAGYARDRSFRTAVYNRADNEWRCPSNTTSFPKSAACRLNGMVQFKARLDWIP